MSIPTKAASAWRRHGRNARVLWARHHHQMQTNARYARALIQGVARALWPQSLERFLFVLASVAFELYRIMRHDGFNLDEAFEA